MQSITVIGALAGILAVTAPALAAPALATPGRVASARAAGVAVVPSQFLAGLARMTHAQVKAPAVTGTLNEPYGIAVDQAGNLYVANIFGGVGIYSEATHKLVNTITAGTNYPAAVAVSFAGNIYVANNGGDNITIYDTALEQIGTITDQTLYSPTSMFIDADDTVWVLDAAGVLHTYLANGQSAGSFASGGTAVGPWGPNVTVWGIADNGAYDETYANRDIDLKDGTGLYNDFVGGSPAAGGETQDAAGQQYVTNIATNQLEIWAANGLYQVAVIQLPATGYGVAVDSTHGRLYVSLTASNEIVAYSTKAPYKMLFVIK